MINKNTHGSEWRKWDLHVHTPSSYDYKDKSITNENLINLFKEKDIAVVAITDHHIIDIDRIKELQKLGKAQNIAVFPGIEFLSETRGKNPVHFIGIFSDKSDVEYIWKQIESKTNICRIQGEHKQINEVYCDLFDTAQLIHELGGIITIHAGSKSNSLDNITNALPHCDAQKNDIAECIDVFELGKEKDIAEYNQYVIPSLLQTIEKEIPMILCSDNHDIKNYVVNQNCWIKADPTFEGLKQIIYEPKARVRIQENKPEEKVDYQIIDSICFDNEEMGKQEIFFNQNLNTIIGGRSSGKSILLGCLAHKIDPSKKAKLDNTKYNDMIDKISKSITIKWKDNQEDSNHKIAYYSQSEISSLCRKQEDGLTGIDKIINEIIRKEEACRIQLEQYDTFKINNKSKLNELINKFIIKHDRVQEILNQIKTIGNKEGIEKEIKKIKYEISKLKENISFEFSEIDKIKYEEKKEKLKNNKKTSEQNLTDIAQLELLKDYQIFNNIDEMLVKISENIKTSVLDFFNNLKEKTKNEWINYISSVGTSLSNNNSSINEENEKIITDSIYINGKKIESENSSFSEKEKLLEQEQEKLDKIIKLEKEKDSVISEKQKIKDDILSTFKEYHTYAEKIIESVKFKKDDVSISSILNVDYENYFNIAKSIFNVKSGEGNNYLQQEIDKTNFLKYTEDIFNKIDSEEIIIKKNDIQQAYISLYTENYFNISYDVEYDGDKLSQMSEGKKAFIVLRLLLDFDDSNCPILIDQPEDDLDNRAIYDDLVKYIRNKKQSRQIIFATHNPNIVVGADAELVIVANQNGIKNKNNNNVKFQYYGNSIENTFTNEQEKSILLSRGIREHICEILEGGEQAFEIREKKYGYKK